MFDRYDFDICHNVNIKKIYVDDTPTSVCVNKNNLKGLFACPFFDTTVDGYVTFGFLNSSNIKKLLSYGSLSISDHNYFLLHKSDYIDSYRHEKVNHSGLKVYVSKDKATKKMDVTNISSTGYNYFEVSSWSHISDDINMEYMKSLCCQVHTVYGKSGGFGSRNVSTCFGINVYSGNRLSSCVRPTPRMGKSMISSSQYTRSSWNFSTMPMVQKTLNRLTYHALHVRLEHNRFHETIIDTCHRLGIISRDIPSKGSFRGLCRVSILTLGNKKCVGFFNEYHVDKNDILETYRVKILLEHIYKEIDLLQSKSVQYKLLPVFAYKLQTTKKAFDYINLMNIGISTTCGYIFINYTQNIVCDDVHAYFLLNDYELAISLSHKLYHNFLAYEFGHQTSFPVIKKNGRIYYNWEGFEIAAWGAGGRKKRS